MKNYIEDRDLGDEHMDGIQAAHTKQLENVTDTLDQLMVGQEIGTTHDQLKAAFTEEIRDDYLRNNPETD